MLSTECKKKDVEILGAEALSGVDRARFEALQQANALVPLDKQLLFYIACLQYNVICTRDEKEVKEEMSWLSNKGDILGKGNPVKWSTNLNLLNSGNDALGESGNANTTRGEHERFGIVAWPACKDIAHKLAFMGEIAATVSALTCTPVDVTRLQHFFLLDAHQFRGDSEIQLLPLSLYKKFCQTVATSGDLTLANEFFSIYFPRLENKDDIIPELATLVRNAGWEGITYLFMYAVDQLEERFDLTLKLIKALGDYHVAQTALTTFAVEQARLAMDLRPVPRVLFDNIPSLWKATSECKNPQLLIDLSSVLQRIDGRVLGAYIDHLSECVDESSLPEHRIALAGILARRREWLIAQPGGQKRSPLWEVSEAPFPDSASISSFVGGPLISLIIRGFVNIGAARARASLLRKSIKGPLDISARGSGLDSYVQMLKFHGMKTSCTTEINRLDKLLVSLKGNENIETLATGNVLANTTGHKRPRDEENGTAIRTPLALLTQSSTLLKD